MPTGHKLAMPSPPDTPLPPSGAPEAGAETHTPAVRHALVGPADLWEMKRRFQIGFLRERGLLPGHRILDLGCGTLRGGIPLIEYLQVGHYTGLEVRPEVLAEGRKELVEAGLAAKHPTLLVCDRLDALALPVRFDFVWAFAVLIHMSDAIMETALVAIGRHLTKHGCFYGNVNVGDGAEGHWQGFPVVCRSWDYYQAAFLRHGLRVEDIGSLTELGHHHPRLGSDRVERQRMLRGWRV
jgi:SAM-dependent methyltransferase